MEETIADLQAKGMMTPEQAASLVKMYNSELSQHGDADRARQALVDFVLMTPEQRKQSAAKATETILTALMRPEYADKMRKIYGAEIRRHPNGDFYASPVISPVIPVPVPTAVKTLQAIAGCAIGAAIGLVATFIVIYFFQYLTSGMSRVRVPIGGIIFVFAGPLIGAIFGTIIGWQFNARLNRDWLQRFLATSSQLDRAWIAWGGIWTAIVFIAFTLFSPFGRGYRLYPADYITILAIVVMGIAGGWAVAQLVRWVKSGRQE